MALTDTAIRSAKPLAKGWKLKDGAKGSRDGGGLHVLIKPNGAKLFRMDYRRPVTGTPNTLSLGAYPATSLATARAERDKARQLLAQGIDPGSHRKATKAAGREQAGNSFEVIAREWLASKATGWESSHTDKQKSRLEKHLLPRVGDKPIGDIAVADLRPLLVSMAKHVEQLHRVMGIASDVFRFAIATGRAEQDPAHALKVALPPRQKQSFPTITDPVAIGGLLRAIDGYDTGTFQVKCALRLAPLTFVRPGELRMARWTELQLDHADGPCWVIPASRRKLRKAAKEDARTPPHIVPLSQQAVAIIEELRPLTGRREFLCPGTRDPKRPISENTVNGALRNLGFDGSEIVGHGFRHMASTLLNELGYDPDMIERQLAHTVPGVRGIYNRAQHMQERHRMMQGWADYLDGLRVGNVVPFKSRVA